MNPTPTVTVYDKNGQPYEADLVDGESYRTIQRELAEAKAHHQRDEALLVQRTDEIRHLEERLKDAATRGAQVALEAYKRDLADIKAERDQLRAECERLKAFVDTPHALHAHCLRTLTDLQIAHLFGEKHTENLNTLRARIAELEAKSTYAQGWDAHVQAVKAQMEELEQDKARLARHIVIHTDPSFKDHACSECVPGSEIVKPGFACAYHTAKAIDAARLPPVGITKTSTSGENLPPSCKSEGSSDAARQKGTT